MAESEKYVVYANDLKHKTHRNIDPTKAEWYDDNVCKKYNEIDHDTIEFRINESQQNNYAYLDLSNLNLKILPKLGNNMKYVKCLFLNNNNLTTCGDEFSQFTNLEVLDISSNEISQITFLPENLHELSCHSNCLTSIISHKNVIRIDCSHNKLHTLGKYDNLKIMLCEKNNLNHIQSYPKLVRLICRNNPITTMDKQCLLTHLDCSNSKLLCLPKEMNSLTHLICNDTPISSLDPSLKLKSLELIGSNIHKLEYYDTLKDLMFAHNENLDIHTKYVLAQFHKQHNNIHVEFHSKE